MSKLLKLNGFVSVNGAQEYLSAAIGSHVPLAELYQLVLSGDLVISARFHGHECALLGKYIPFSPTQYSDLLEKNQIPEEWNWVDITYIHYDGKRNQYYAVNPSATNITGCWDFSMLGAEVNVIDHFYRIQAANSINGGLSGINLQIERSDILLTNGDQVARLQPENESKQHVIFDYFLNMLVFKKQELSRFIQSLEGTRQEAKPSAQKAYTKNNDKQTYNKAKTQAKYAVWQRQAIKLKKKHPNKSKTWISAQIERLPIAEGKSADTIRKNIKI